MTNKNDANKKPVSNTKQKLEKSKTGPDKMRLTEHQWATVEKHAGFNLSIRAAAKAIGVSYKTIERRLSEQGKSWTDFKLECKEPMQFMIASKLMWLAIEKNNLGALIWLSKNVCGWSDNPMPIESEDDRAPATYTIIAKKPREEVKQITVVKAERVDKKKEVK